MILRPSLDPPLLVYVFSRDVIDGKLAGGADDPMEFVVGWGESGCWCGMSRTAFLMQLMVTGETAKSLDDAVATMEVVSR